MKDEAAKESRPAEHPAQYLCDIQDWFYKSH